MTEKKERGDIATRFQPGNQLWKKCLYPGRKPAFSSPEQLWSECCGYFQWVEDNPLWEDRVAQYQGEPVSLPVCKMRAMTIDGLCVYLNITKETWRDYRSKPVFSDVVSKVDDIIREQKLTGAAADLLNANIIARDLGLRDVKDVSVKRDTSDLSDEELDREIKVRQQALLRSQDD